MRSNRVVRASDSQCQSYNCPVFDPSNLSDTVESERGGRWRSVEYRTWKEKIQKNPPLIINGSTGSWFHNNAATFFPCSQWYHQRRLPKYGSNFRITDPYPGGHLKRIHRIRLHNNAAKYFFPPLSDPANAEVRIKLQNYGSVSRRSIINGSTGSWFHNNAATFFFPPLSDPTNAEVRIQLQNYGSVSRRSIINGSTGSWCTTVV